jgi:segregation and condensation protein B
MTNDGDLPFGTAGDLAQCYERLLDQEGYVSGAESEGPPRASESPPVEEAASPPPLRRIIEAMLFVGGAPLTAARAAEAVRGLTVEQFRDLLDELNRDYRQQGRPYRIQVREQGCELVLQPQFRGVLDRLYGSTREARLSPAALDVLALVAYRQPLTKQDVEGLRGAESAGALRQLVRLGLIAVQRGEADQREVMYSTTSRFLTLFQLRSLDDLPRTQDLQKL